MAHDPTREPRRARCPEEVLAWIPWYADGGLDAREKGAVEAHAAECGDCRSELDLVAGEPWACEGIDLPDRDRLFDEITARIAVEARGERATVIPISRGRGLSAEDMGRIERWVLDPGSERVAEIDDAPFIEELVEERIEEGGGETARATAGEPGERPRPTLGGRRAAFATSPIWAAAAALVLLFVGGLGGAWVENLRSVGATDPAVDSAVYQLASAGPDGVTAGSPMLDVVFSDGVSARQIWSSLRSLGVEIVAGPTNLGVYRLRLLPAAAEGRDPTAADAAAIAARLVAPDAPIAIFAEPVP